MRNGTLPVAFLSPEQPHSLGITRVPNAPPSFCTADLPVKAFACKITAGKHSLEQGLVAEGCWGGRVNSRLHWSFSLPCRAKSPVCELLGELEMFLHLVVRRVPPLHCSAEVTPTGDAVTLPYLAPGDTWLWASIWLYRRPHSASLFHHPSWSASCYLWKVSMPPNYCSFSSHNNLITG